MDTRFSPLRFWAELMADATRLGLVKEPTEEQSKSRMEASTSSRFTFLRSTMSLRYTSENREER